RSEVQRAGHLTALCWEDGMNERELKTLLDEVKSGRLSRRRFVQTMVGLGLGGRGGDEVDVQSDEAGRRRHRQDALVASTNTLEPTLRERHQGPGRLPDFL